MPRLSASELESITQRKGYGVKSQVGGGVAKSLKAERAISEAGGEGEMSILERGPRPKSVRPQELTIPYSGCVLVSVKVYRQRLTDTGNDCWKYHLDACRYLGLLADDNDAAIRLTEEPHEKVKTKEEERVEITLTYPGIDLEGLCHYYEGGSRNKLPPQTEETL